jgi:hypothetical protein
MMSKRVQQLDVAVETKTRVRAHVEQHEQRCYNSLQWTPASELAANYSDWQHIAAVMTQL